MSKIFIRKEAGQRKDAFRINGVNDIPDFLRKTVTVDGETVNLVCVEGAETCRLGAVIGYEKSDRTPTGWNAWVIGNAATSLIEKDGVFYKKAMVLEAEVVGDEIPAFLEGVPGVVRNKNGSWTVHTDWGWSTGFPGQAYWIRYGVKEDGTPDVNILSKSEKSYRDYIVCKEDGTAIGKLAEIDPR